MNNKILLGIIGLVLLIVGALVGYVLPKNQSTGSVEYDKKYLKDVDVSGTATINDLVVSGDVSGISTSSLSSLTVTGASTFAAVTASGLVTMSGAATVGTTFGVTGTSTFSGQVGIQKCMTAKSTYGGTIYLTFATTTGDGSIVATSTKPSDCN